ncbi:MAG: ArsR family transcriptional regulator [Planctomycetota bacterium]|nr:MAG: ArsR family transcriptional regulator [Planctomycetota bacterium]
MVVDTLSLTLGAVSDPTRRSILERLAEGPAAVRDLVARFDLTQQAISKHVAVLVRARLVRKQQRGRLCYCALDAQPLAELAEWTDAYRAHWEARYQKLDALLDELQSAPTPAKKKTR